MISSRREKKKKSVREIFLIFCNLKVLSEMSEEGVIMKGKD